MTLSVLTAAQNLLDQVSYVEAGPPVVPYEAIKGLQAAVTEASQKAAGRKVVTPAQRNAWFLAMHKMLRHHTYKNDLLRLPFVRDANFLESGNDEYRLRTVTDLAVGTYQFVGGRLLPMGNADTSECPTWGHAAGEAFVKLTLQGDKLARFINMIKRVLPYAETDDVRPYLKVANLSLSNGNLYLATTDGYRMAKDEMPAEGIATWSVDEETLASGWCFPRPVLDALLKDGGLLKEDRILTVEFAPRVLYREPMPEPEDSWQVLTIASRGYWVLQWAGPAPRYNNWRNVVNRLTMAYTRITVARDALLEILGTAKNLLEDVDDKEYNAINLRIQRDEYPQLWIHAANEQRHLSITEKIPCKCSLEKHQMSAAGGLLVVLPMRYADDAESPVHWPVTFQYPYLISALSFFTGPTVTLAFCDTLPALKEYLQPALATDNPADAVA